MEGPSARAALLVFGLFRLLLCARQSWANLWRIVWGQFMRTFATVVMIGAAVGLVACGKSDTKTNSTCNGSVTGAGGGGGGAGAGAGGGGAGGGAGAAAGRPAGRPRGPGA